MAGINIAGKVKNTNVSEQPINISISGIRSASLSLDAADRVRIILFVVGIASIHFTKVAVEDMVAKKQAVLVEISTQKDQEIANQNRKIKELQSIKTEADQFDNVLAEVKRKLNLAESVGRDRNFVIRAVDFVVQQMPAKVWMKSILLDVSNDKKLYIEGAATAMQPVSDFLFKLQPGSFFANWELEETLNFTNAATAGSKTGPLEYKNFKIKATVSEP